jgi:hypothetical protein
MDITEIENDVLMEEKSFGMKNDKVCIPPVFSLKCYESEVRHVFTLFLWFLFLYVRRAVVCRHLLFYIWSLTYIMVEYKFLCGI